MFSLFYFDIFISYFIIYCYYFFIHYVLFVLFEFSIIIRQYVFFPYILVFLIIYCYMVFYLKLYYFVLCDLLYLYQIVYVLHSIRRTVIVRHILSTKYTFKLLKLLSLAYTKGILDFSLLLTINSKDFSTSLKSIFSWDV